MSVVRYSTISAIGTFTALSESSTDYLRIVAKRCAGGGDRPLRTTVEPAPGQSKAIIRPPLGDAQIITLGGDMIIGSATDESGYLSALDTLFGSLQTALDLMMAAPDDVVHATGTLSCWKYAPLDQDWQDALMSVTFGLVVDDGL